ncbi:MAG: choice-of-anchor O protein [Pseudomonadota bacterium]
MKLRTLAVHMAALTLVSAPLFADDGTRLTRNMSQQESDIYACPSEGEHAFTRLMNFRVPAQAASGLLLDEIEYLTVDLDSSTQTTAKPIVSVYVFGPVLGVEGADGFQGHGKRDAYASISLDDGTTWKTVNLSNSTDLSSFEVTTPIPVPGEYCEDVPIDWNTTVSTGDLDTDNMLASLDVAAVSAAEEDEDDGLHIEEASWDDLNNNFGRLEVEGEADSRDRVRIVNGVTGDVLFATRADREGEFEVERNVALTKAPCTVAALVDGVTSDYVEVEDAPSDCIGPVDVIPTTADYPGDNNNIFHAVSGNKILVAWQSRYCQAGQPAYAMDDAAKDEIAGYLGIDRTVDLYLEDLFVVGGAQSSLDYTDEGFPQVGEIPFNCLWTARGVLREDPENDGVTEVVWFQNERLTSGRRDLTRIETQCAAGGGCAITWQEDPVGLRPGEGEGPGTGWAGATTNSKTDIWYSFIPWEHFDIVDVDGSAANAIPLGSEIVANKPGAFVPFAVPVRLTNNDRCTYPINPLDVSYCNEEIAGAYGIKDQCVGSVEIPLGPQGNLTPICVVDANDNGVMDYGDLPNLANQAASRPRLNVKSRDADGDGATDGAYIVVVHEEDKGLGRFGFEKDEEWTGSLDDTATFCSDDPDADLTDTCLKADVGKNVLYLSFAMGTAQTSLSEEGYGLLDNVVYQGAQINKPENNWRTGDLYRPMDTLDMWDFGELNYLIFDTQIARRTTMMSQSIAKAENSENGLLAMPLFKEGVMNQGGPADIQAVRVTLPCDDDHGNQPDDVGSDNGGPPDDCVADQENSNPYAAENLVCDNLWFDPETDPNPYYPNGLCMLSTINLSGMTPLTCEQSGDLSTAECPGTTAGFACEDTEFGQLCITDVDPEDQQLFPKLLEWYECPGSNGTGLSPDCYTEPVSATLGSNIDDQAWFMPLDVSKAHRGFIDGDFVAMMYAKSPNWKLNTVGNDRYELYLRKSFDGGVTWTTAPSTFEASNGESYSGSGTTTCETWRAIDGSSIDEISNCTTYDAGVAEQSRNMSQLKSMAFTILDPRYSPTIGGMVELDLSAYGDIFTYVHDGAHANFEDTDVRRPDRLHIVYETGDNTTVAIGEGEPLNLNYGRGFNFGDHFQVWYDEELEGTDITETTSCYPSEDYGDDVNVEVIDSGFCNEFDTLEGSQLDLSEEASMTSSASGDFLYAVWGNINLDQDLHHIDGEARFRRVWWLDGYLPSDAYENLVPQ